MSFASVANCAVIPDDPVNVWRDHDMVDRLGPPETEVLYLGGAWLEEEVLIAALSAVRIGYDTRVFTDLSVLRSLSIGPRRSIAWRNTAFSRPPSARP